MVDSLLGRLTSADRALVAAVTMLALATGVFACSLAQFARAGTHPSSDGLMVFLAVFGALLAAALGLQQSARDFDRRHGAQLRLWAGAASRFTRRILIRR